MEINDDKLLKIAYFFVILALSVSAIFIFQAKTLQDNDYGFLLKSSLTVETAKTINAMLFVLLPLMIYTFLVYALKKNAFHSFGAAALFCVAGLNIESFFSFSPLLGFALGKNYEILDIIKGTNLILPFAIVALLSSLLRIGKNSSTDIISPILVGFGLILLAFAPGISLVLLAFSAAKGIEALENMRQKEIYFVIVVFIFIFQLSYSGDIVAAFAISVLIGIIAHILVSIHSLNTSDISAFIFFLFIFGIIGATNSIYQAQMLVPMESELQLWKGYVHEMQGIEVGQFGVFDYPNAFAYYSGKNPIVLNGTALLKKDVVLSNITHVVISTRALDKIYSEKPIFFFYLRTINASADTNSETVIFRNNRYALQIHSRANEFLIEDGQIYDLKTGESTSVLFTKLKSLYNITYKNDSNRMVNIQGIEGSALHSLLFNSKVIYRENGAMIVKVE